MMDIKHQSDERKLLAEGIRVVSDGTITRIYDIESGAQIQYVTRFHIDINVHDPDWPKKHGTVLLEIDVPRVEYDGPAELIARLWPTQEMLDETARNDVAQAIHDEFAPGHDGHDICNHAGGARAAIFAWAKREGIEIEPGPPVDHEGH